MKNKVILLLIFCFIGIVSHSQDFKTYMQNAQTYLNDSIVCFEYSVFCFRSHNNYFNSINKTPFFYYKEKQDFYMSFMNMIYIYTNNHLLLIDNDAKVISYSKQHEQYPKYIQQKTQGFNIDSLLNSAYTIKNIDCNKNNSVCFELHIQNGIYNSIIFEFNTQNNFFSTIQFQYPENELNDCSNIKIEYNIISLKANSKKDLFDISKYIIKKNH